MPLRAWEFAAGGAVPWVVRRIGGWSGRRLDLLLLLGLTLLVTAVAGFGVGIPFPSYKALLPVAGAVLVIAAGVARGPNGLAARLTPRWILHLGLISYPLYLWHWPTLVFARIHGFGELSPMRALAAVALSLVLAEAVHFLVERPIAALRRRRPAIARSWWPTVIGLALSVAVALVAPSTLPRGEVIAPRGKSKPLRSFERCSSDRDVARCRGRKGDVTLLVGDSHARYSGRVFDKYSSGEGRVAFVAAHNGCRPIFGLESVGETTNLLEGCRKMKRDLRRQLRAGKLRPTSVILFARWGVDFAVGEGARRSGPSFQMGKEGSGEAAPDQEAFFVEQFGETIATFRAAGVRRTLVIAPVPELLRDRRPCLLRARLQGSSSDDHCTVPRWEIELMRGPALRALERAVRGVEDVRLADPIDVFCDEEVCRPNRGDVLLYNDSNHLGEEGTLALVEGLSDDFEWLWER